MLLKRVIPVLMLTVALSAVKSQAQEKKNYISGTIGFNNSKQEANGDEIKSNDFTIAPTYGHYISNKFSIALSVGYSHGTGDQKLSGATTKSDGFHVSPFVRFEQPIWSDKLSVFNDVGLMYLHNKTTVDTKGSDQQESSLNMSMLFYRPGLLVNLTKRSAITLSLGELLTVAHSVNKSPTGSTTTQTSAGIQSGFGINSLSFGFQYKF
ncbi:outer membrane beta-barrel protein [Chitinophaga sp. Hz27]|uniref:outer membrane beta-barrel protein n=1 Tax=Chitinophaga sp. Hz27 TaxID=3347169 RepID=UPI0035DE3872